ncbi:Zn(2)-C6 fungal-type domain-containing protein [Mycena venus]|uniref:Zn(2)-C6 fungal-type domain-containing protein n=1 Tax=Mycena venus TaxID=2733690 RepID=A0A8H7CUY1_9AGAR|nr:Zn(2)-C6 fungal-type domain-containing protein [Mycena venus]
MSSEERDALEPIVVPAKKRRIQRACDACRQKRRACDGLRSSTKKCTYCVENGVECIYSGAPTTTKRQSYTEILEARLALTEKLLHKLSAQGSHSPGTTESSEWSKDSPIVQHGNAAGGSGLSAAVELAAMSIRAINEREPQYPDEDDRAHADLIRTMQGLKIGSHNDSFMGKSSGAMLVKAAMDLKEQYKSSSSDGEFQRPWASRRMQFWTSTPWTIEPKRPRYTFPPPDLLSALVNLYFEQSNVNIPLLHRPTFERALADDLHLRDDKFAANVLSVCAVASRFSDDPRVYDPAESLTCGWKFFSQISSELEHLYDPPKLYDLQRYCLAIQFLDGAAPQGNWTLIGIGIRMAQEVGAHRRQHGPHTVTVELWRRAFWVLVAYDRLVSCTLGRPCAMQYDDFDIELPTECDDEYWENDEDPALAFRQPPGKPSRVAFFNSYLRLNNILAFVLHLLYSLNKTKDLFAANDRAWDEHIVAELDSALNKWVDSIPEHLRWDPQRADLVFFKQSVALYCAYYHVQMTTHRPFIPMMREAPTTLPSLAICTNAGRSCSHVVDVWRQRTKDTPAVILLASITSYPTHRHINLIDLHYHLQPALTTAGVILLLNVWSGKRTGLAPHMNTTITEVHKCMQAIRAMESRWMMAGLFYDILNELASIGQVSLPARPHVAPTTDSPTRPAANQRKRAHSGYDEARYTHSSPLELELETPVVSQAADPGLVLPADFEEIPFAWLGAMESGASALPMYAEELSRLPVFPPPPVPPFQHTMQQYPSMSTSTAGWAPNSSVHTSSSGPGSGLTQKYQFTGPPGTEQQGGLGTGISAEDVLSMIDNDAMAMWTNAPAGLGADDWGTYFSLMNEMNQGPLP